MDVQQTQKQKRPWLPQSREGKRATVFSALAVLWGIFMPIVPFPEWMINLWWAHVLFGGPPRILLLLVILILGTLYLYKAVFKVKDRAILVLIFFVLFCLVAAFWVFFIIGEFAFPH